jgi:hypothetical protein
MTFLAHFCEFGMRFNKMGLKMGCKMDLKLATVKPPERNLVKNEDKWHFYGLRHRFGSSSSDVT